eukprot:CAMPEP_0184304688 /NCGR_PEP_ID=MMETSP1049-20130417/14140_1 /TAXON_ID=77928 /ORGANISM="Proteomonas sulcata, Strain CCMP704" /LENGTH=342 /DNA_ID=CAMNT_0026616543 /DNA_START=1 /DNA_END=1029 /DNA_ORIENTATION=+
MELMPDPAQAVASAVKTTVQIEPMHQGGASAADFAQEDAENAIPRQIMMPKWATREGVEAANHALRQPFTVPLEKNGMPVEGAVAPLGEYAPRTPLYNNPLAQFIPNVTYHPNGDVVYGFDYPPGEGPMADKIEEEIKVAEEEAGLEPDDGALEAEGEETGTLAPETAEAAGTLAPQAPEGPSPEETKEAEEEEIAAAVEEGETPQEAVAEAGLTPAEGGEEAEQSPSQTLARLYAELAKVEKVKAFHDSEVKRIEEAIAQAQMSKEAEGQEPQNMVTETGAPSAPGTKEVSPVFGDRDSLPAASLGASAGAQAAYGVYKGVLYKPLLSVGPSSLVRPLYQV